MNNFLNSGVKRRRTSGALKEDVEALIEFDGISMNDAEAADEVDGDHSFLRTSKCEGRITTTGIYRKS